MTNDHGNAVARATKTELRGAVRLRLAQMSRRERDLADEIVCLNLVTLARQLEVSFVVAYLALPDEVCVDHFLAAMVELGVPTLLPAVTAGGEIALGSWRPGLQLRRDREGVPAPGSAALATSIGWPTGSGLLVVPGRVFDTEGARVGRGLGYYDRFLAGGRLHALVMGAAYECQVVERVPREPHDISVDGLATETGCRRFAGSRDGRE